MVRLHDSRPTVTRNALSTTSAWESRLLLLSPRLFLVVFQRASPRVNVFAVRVNIDRFRDFDVSPAVAQSTLRRDSVTTVLAQNGQSKGRLRLREPPQLAALCQMR